MNVSQISVYVEKQQKTLCDLLLSLSLDERDSLFSDGVVSIGRCDIWPCSDGAVVLFYHDLNMKVDVRVCASQSLSVNEFLARSEDRKSVV